MLVRTRCSVHGELNEYNSEWVECWNCGGDGEFDGYEEDPLWYDEGETYPCDICRGNGGWLACGQCITVEEETHAN